MMDPPPPYESTPSEISETFSRGSTRISMLHIERPYGDNGFEERRDYFKLLMPRMHMYMAGTCAVFNFILPGIGTILAAFSVFFCCAKSDDLTTLEQFGSFLVGVFIGLLQIILVPVFFIGWIWSVVWGLAMIGVSDEKYHGNLSPESASMTGSTSGLSVPSASHIHLSRSSSINDSIGPNSFPFEAIYASTAQASPLPSAHLEEIGEIPNTPPPPYEDSTIAEVSL